MAELEEIPDQVVITTRHGSTKKFHRKGCNYIGEKTRTVDYDHADRFFEKCSFCWD